MVKCNLLKINKKSSFLFAFFVIAATWSAAQTVDTIHPYFLQDVRISTARPSGESSFSVSHVSRGDIAKQQGNGSVNNLLEQVPGVVTTSDAGTGLGYSYMRIRGIDHTRINVTINGVALNDAESQGSWFVNLPDFGSHVQTLQVQRGVGTSNNGSAAFGATMNFATLAPATDPFAQISSTAGSFYTLRQSVCLGTGLLKDVFAATAGYSYIQSKGYIEHASAKLHSAFLTADYHLVNKKRNRNFGKLQLHLLYGNEKTGLAWNGVPADSLTCHRRYNSCGEYFDTAGNRHHYENETDNYQQTHAQLHYDWQRFIGEKQHWKLHAALHLTRGIGFYEEYKANQTAATFGLQLPATDHVSPEPTIDAITRKYLDNYFYGGLFHLEHQIKKMFTWVVGGAVNRFQGAHYGTLQWLSFTAAPPASHHWYDGSGDKRQLNLYGKFITELTHPHIAAQTTLYADLQYRHIFYQIGGTDDNLCFVAQKHLWHFVNPKVGANFRWRRKHTHEVYATFGVANREPTRADLTAATTAAHRPKPETLYDCEAGYLLHTVKWQATATLYYMYYRNQLVLTGEINNVGATIMTNVPQSFRTGVELSSTYQPLAWLRWNLNGTLSINRILNYTEFVDDWDTGTQRANFLGSTTISFSPSMVASNTLTFTPLANFNIALVTKFVSRQYIDNSAQKAFSIKPYSVSNLQLSYTIHTKPIAEIGIFLHINNLFNAQYESNAWLYRYYFNNEERCENGYFPQAGIHVIGGVSLRF